MYECYKQIVICNASTFTTVFWSSVCCYSDSADCSHSNVAISAVRRSIATVLIEANQICNISEYKFWFVIFLHCFILFTANFIYLNLWSEQSHNYESWMTFILSSHELKVV